MKLTIKVGQRTSEVTVENSATVMDLKREYKKQCKKDVHRQSFKVETDDPKKPVRLDDDKERIDFYGVKNGDELVFKDLGPQIGYRTVFLVEYAGPLFIVLFYALRPSFIYGAAAKDAEFHPVAKLAIFLWTLHFLKREVETMFVHKFSRATMPFTNLFKNSIYYWAFAAVIGYPLCHPLYTAPSQPFVLVGAIIFIASELGNLMVHIYLSQLRPAEGSKKRPVPAHPLFKLVSCPNYTFEVLSWVGFSIMTSILFSWAFTLVGFLQMADWAVKKHKGYLRMYGDEYKKLRRKAIVPFML